MLLSHVCTPSQSPNPSLFTTVSWFGNLEGELLLSPNMEFLVTRPLHDPTDEPLRSLCAAEGCQCVEMTQIPDDALWS